MHGTNGFFTSNLKRDGHRIAKMKHCVPCKDDRTGYLRNTFNPSLLQLSSKAENRSPVPVKGALNLGNEIFILSPEMLNKIMTEFLVSIATFSTSSKQC